MLSCKSLVYGMCMAAGLAVFAGGAHAIPFQITSQLTGDPRLENPDGIVVNITIDADTTSNQAIWTVDLDSPVAHPDMKLHELYFNMLGSAGDYVFSNFSPASWSVQLNDNVKGAGSGGSTFLFEALDPQGGPKVNITNSVLLTFTMTKVVGNFNPLDFINAPKTTTSAGFNSQVGAHLQNLTTSKIGKLTTADSGFATGDFSYDPPVPPLAVPEPNIALLIGGGLLGMALIRRRKSSSRQHTSN